MKKNYLIILLVATVTLTAVLFPCTIHSQDLTDEQRKERCQNNRSRIAELEAQLKVISAQFSSTMTRKEFEDATKQMVLVKSMKDKRDWDDEDKNADLLKIAGTYNFKFMECLNNSVGNSNKCIGELANIIASKIDKAKAFNRPEIMAKKNDLEKQLAFHQNNLLALGCDQFSATGKSTGSPCFSSDPAMGSTNREDHYNWARNQDGSQLEANIKSKMNLLYNCPSVTDDAFAAAFADISVIISQYAQEIPAFNNDAGAKKPDISAQLNWAKNQGRQQVLQNLQWKMETTFKVWTAANRKYFLQTSRYRLHRHLPQTQQIVTMRTTREGILIKVRSRMLVENGRYG